MKFNTPNRMTLTGLSLLILTLIISIAGCAGDSATVTNGYDDQIAIVTSGNSAFNQLDWEAYAALVHPDGLAKFRGTVLPGIEKLVLQTQSDTVNLFGKVFNAEEIQTASPEKFFVEIMSMAIEVSVELKGTFETMQNETLGAIPDGDSLVHVICRTNIDIGGQKYNEMNVFSLSQYEGEWKLSLSPKIEGIAFMIRSGLPQ